MVTALLGYTVLGWFPSVIADCFTLDVDKNRNPPTQWMNDRPYTSQIADPLGLRVLLIRGVHKYSREIL